MRRKVFIGALFLAALASLGAAGTDQEIGRIRLQPVQHNGRIKPFDSFARETLWQITGAPRLGRQDPAETVLSIVSEPDRWLEKPILQVPFVPLRQALGMDPSAERVSYSDLLSTRRLMRMLPAIVEKQGRGEKLSMLENETMDLFNRFAAFSDLTQGKIPWLPPGSPPVPAWRMRLETAYNQTAPFRIARWLYLLAVLWLAGGVAEGWPIVRAAGMALVAAGFCVHAAGIFFRVLLAGRPPVSNFYETMLWIPFVAVAVSLVFERIYRVRYFALSASILSVLLLSLSESVPLDPSLSPVVAVLRSNVWLTVHVLTIVASYGALGLAGVMAHLYGWRYLASGGAAEDLVSLEQFLYRTIQIGVVLLAAGIMLGGVWANASWGRYWGWDPKETWALITLLWFLAALHGRFAGWLRGVGLALATIGGLFLLLMTYYGVSFYLVGLHSYAGGHAKPLPPLIVAYAAVEGLFLACVGWAAARRDILKR